MEKEIGGSSQNNKCIGDEYVAKLINDIGFCRSHKRQNI